MKTKLTREHYEKDLERMREARCDLVMETNKCEALITYLEKELSKYPKCQKNK